VRCRRRDTDAGIFRGGCAERDADARVYAEPHTDGDSHPHTDRDADALAYGFADAYAYR
jgi:hypothetical protein